MSFSIICNECNESNDTYVSVNPITMEVKLNCGNCDNEESQ